MATMSLEDLHSLMKYYEQAYFTFDDPVPFKDIYVYPVCVKDYYKFYAALYIIKMDKNEDFEGISMSHLGYLLHKIENDDNGKIMYNQFISIMEMVLHIKNGLKCPKCGSVILDDDIQKILKKIDTKKDKTEKELLLNAYINKVNYCEHCSTNEERIQREPIIELCKIDKKPTLIIDGQQYNKDDYDLLRNIILYYNLPDYKDDYINPDLKKELEEVARLKNPNAVQPSLEKQMSCILSATGCYTYKTIQEISIRKLVILLRTIDARLHYFAYRQGEMSGMVKFEKELDHWIYSSDKKDNTSSLMTLDSFKNKMKDVT